MYLNNKQNLIDSINEFDNDKDAVSRKNDLWHVPRWLFKSKTFMKQMQFR